MDQDLMANALKDQLGKSYYSNAIVREQDLICD
jgi:hypothetical protein